MNGNKIKEYQPEDGLKNTEEKYIDKILTKKTEKNGTNTSLRIRK